MAAITYDFNIEQGSYSTVTFVYQDVNGNNVDLTGWCVILQWKDDLNNTKVFSNREKNNTYDITTYSDGRIVFNLPSLITNTYNFDKALYDIDLQEPNEQYFGSGYRTFRLATGTINLIKRSNPQPLLINCADIVFSSNTECPAECLVNDIYAVKYNGNGLEIPDMSFISDTISISDTRIVEKVEVVINGLNHKSPQDLRFVLSSPSGDMVLLSYNNKIPFYVPGFNFIFSDDAPSGSYLHNIRNNQRCRIYEKDLFCEDNNYLFNLSDLSGSSSLGDWTLSVYDSDPIESGTISSWSLVITYVPEEDI